MTLTNPTPAPAVPPGTPGPHTPAWELFPYGKSALFEVKQAGGHA